MTEGEIQREIIYLLEKRGNIVIRHNAGKVANNVRLSPKGTPDLQSIGPDGHMWIEVKTPTGKLRPEQGIMINKLQKFGERVIIARSVEDVANEL